MKRVTIYLLLLFAALLPQRLEAQAKPFVEFQDRFAGREGITSVDMSSSMFRMISRSQSLDAEFANMLDDLKRLSVVVCDEVSMLEEFSAHARNVINYKEYQLLSSVRQEQTQISICMRELGRKEFEYLVAVIGEDEGVLMCIIGNLTLDQVLNLAGNAE